MAHRPNFSAGENYVLLVEKQDEKIVINIFRFDSFLQKNEPKWTNLEA